jgi:hypothetical protein
MGWINNRSLETRKCRYRHGRRDSYFDDFEPHERGDEGRPSGPANLGCLLLLVGENDANLQTDPVALDVPELRKRLLGDIDGFLDVQEMDQQVIFAISDSGGP